MIPYLDKFAVDPGAQGKGISELLWMSLKSAYPRLYWRSRVGNPVNPWYFDRSCGNFKLDGKWMLFWYGELDLRRLDACRGLVGQIDASFDDV